MGAAVKAGVIEVFNEIGEDVFFGVKWGVSVIAALETVNAEVDNIVTADDVGIVDV